jgi:hypothetical protein
LATCNLDPTRLLRHPGVVFIEDPMSFVTVILDATILHLDKHPNCLYDIFGIYVFGNKYFSTM